MKRGEENALKNYNEAIDGLSPDTPGFTTVVDQRNRIRTVIQRVEQLIPVYDD